jgi:predicted metal-dependent peptidase
MASPLPEVAVVCDTSGSMDDAELSRCVAEVDGIIAGVGLRSRPVPVLSVDSEVQSVRRVRRASRVQLQGGGGTDMGKGIEAAMALRPRPQVIVVLTDGWTPWPIAPPRGARVVAGLVGAGAAEAPLPPAWVRAVVIGEPE